MIIYKLTYYSFFIFIVCLHFSCSLINKEEEIPAYVKIDSISIETNYLTEGTSKSNFSDAWVYIDDQLQGIYELPASFPVLKNGSYNLKIRGGIKVSGISANRQAYAFCNYYEDFISLSPNNISTVSAKLSYFSSTTFKWLEDFENIGVSLTTSTESDTSLLFIEDTLAFEGRKSAAIYLDSLHTFFECKSSIPFNVPISSNVFLELHYQCNNSFIIGVISQTTSIKRDLLLIKSSTNWNKIYIDLRPAINAISNSPFYIFISTTSDNKNNHIFIDNIKLLCN